MSRREPADAGQVTLGGRKVRSAGSRFYIEPHLRRYLEDADCLLVDGTVWTDDELARHGISERAPARWATLPFLGEGRMLSVVG